MGQAVACPIPDLRNQKALSSPPLPLNVRDDCPAGKTPFVSIEDPDLMPLVTFDLWGHVHVGETYEFTNCFGFLL